MVAQGTVAQVALLLAHLLRRAFYTEFLHVLVFGNLGFDMMSLEYQGQRQPEGEQSDRPYRDQYYYKCR